MNKKRFVPLILSLGTFALASCTWFTDPPSGSNSAIVSENAAASGPATKVNADGSINNEAGQTFYVVSTEFTPLYRTGPQQPNGPDQSLPKDTLVTLLKRNFGFSRVQLENGINGYVATEDLKLATAERIAPPAPVSTLNTENNSAIVEHYSVEKAARSAATSTSNAEALPELPEPRLEPEPTPIEKPDFRY